MRIFKGFVASVMIHLFFFTSCYLLVIWWKNSPFSAVDIDPFAQAGKAGFSVKTSRNKG